MVGLEDTHVQGGRGYKHQKNHEQRFQIIIDSVHVFLLEQAKILASSYNDSYGRGQKNTDHIPVLFFPAGIDHKIEAVLIRGLFVGSHEQLLRPEAIRF
jgi:hypothetical protein